MSKQTIIVCDKCGERITSRFGPVKLFLRQGRKVLQRKELCDKCAAKVAA